MPRAGHPRCVRLQEAPHHAQVQGTPPAAPTPRVIEPALLPAFRAAQPVPTIRAQPDHHDLAAVRCLPDIPLLEHDMLDMQQLLPWLGFPPAAPGCSKLTLAKPAR